jgi:hypothetical protein
MKAQDSAGLMSYPCDSANYIRLAEISFENTFPSSGSGRLSTQITHPVTEDGSIHGQRRFDVFSSMGSSLQR